MPAPTDADRLPARSVAARPRTRPGVRAALIPGWLIFFLLGMAAIAASEVLPGSPALEVESGVLAAP